MNTDVTLIDLPPTPIAYFRHTGPYGPPVARFWMERMAPWMAENDLFGRERYGIAHDDPSITEPAKCRYDAGVAVEARGSAFRPAAAHRHAWRALRLQPVRGHHRRHRRRLAATDLRLAADERPAARRPADARALSGRHEVRSRDRRVRLQAVHPGGPAMSRAGLSTVRASDRPRRGPAGHAARPSCAGRPRRRRRSERARGAGDRGGAGRGAGRAARRRAPGRPRAGPAGHAARRAPVRPLSDGAGSLSRARHVHRRCRRPHRHRPRCADGGVELRRCRSGRPVLVDGSVAPRAGAGERSRRPRRSGDPRPRRRVAGARERRPHRRPGKGVARHRRCGRGRARGARRRRRRRVCRAGGHRAPSGRDRAGRLGRRPVHRAIDGAAARLARLRGARPRLLPRRRARALDTPAHARRHPARSAGGGPPLAARAAGRRRRPAGARRRVQGGGAGAARRRHVCLGRCRGGVRAQPRGVGRDSGRALDARLPLVVDAGGPAAALRALEPAGRAARRPHPPADRQLATDRCAPRVAGGGERRHRGGDHPGRAQPRRDAAGGGHRRCDVALGPCRRTDRGAAGEGAPPRSAQVEYLATGHQVLGTGWAPTTAFQRGAGRLQGGNAALDAAAQAQGWARLLAFLSRHLGPAS